MSEKQWNDINREVSNWMTAADVVASYSVLVDINGRNVRLTGQNAINYLVMLAEQGTQINGSN